MDMDFLKQTIADNQRCYAAGMDTARHVSPSISEFAMQENRVLRIAIMNVLLAYDSSTRFENVSVPAPLSKAIETARTVVK